MKASKEYSGNVMDRDLSGAVSITNEGLRIFRESLQPEQYTSWLVWDVLDPYAQGHLARREDGTICPLRGDGRSRKFLLQAVRLSRNSSQYAHSLGYYFVYDIIIL